LQEQVKELQSAYEKLKRDHEELKNDVRGGNVPRASTPLPVEAVGATNRHLQMARSDRSPSLQKPGGNGARKGHWASVFNTCGAGDGESDHPETEHLQRGRMPTGHSAPPVRHSPPYVAGDARSAGGVSVPLRQGAAYQADELASASPPVSGCSGGGGRAARPQHGPPSEHSTQATTTAGSPNLAPGSGPPSTQSHSPPVYGFPMVAGAGSTYASNFGWPGGEAEPSALQRNAAEMPQSQELAGAPYGNHAATLAHQKTSQHTPQQKSPPMRSYMHGGDGGLHIHVSDQSDPYAGRGPPSAARADVSPRHEPDNGYGMFAPGFGARVPDTNGALGGGQRTPSMMDPYVGGTPASGRKTDVEVPFPEADSDGELGS